MYNFIPSPLTNVEQFWDESPWKQNARTSWTTSFRKNTPLCVTICGQKVSEITCSSVHVCAQIFSCFAHGSVQKVHIYVSIYINTFLTYGTALPPTHISSTPIGSRALCHSTSFHCTLSCWFTDSCVPRKAWKRNACATRFRYFPITRFYRDGKLIVTKLEKGSDGGGGREGGRKCRGQVDIASAARTMTDEKKLSISSFVYR